MGEKMAELKIEKKEYGFRLIINNDESYFINDKGDWFTVVIEREREAIDIIDDKYENLGVKDLNELLCTMIERPATILEMLLGGKKDIEKVIVEFS